MGTWEQWRPATCMPDACFCETIRDSVIRQPVNTLSSLAFVVVAILVLRTARRDADQPTTMHGLQAFPLLYALALLIIGFGSAFYHASLTFAGQFADVFGMYLVATFVVLYSLGRRRPMKAPVLVTGYLLLNGLLAWLLYTLPQLRRYAFGAVLLLGIAVEFSARRTARDALDARFLARGLLLIAAGFGLWILDITRTVCAPGSILQGHAAWHVLGAAASWQLYRYYRSRRATS